MDKKNLVGYDFTDIFIQFMAFLSIVKLKISIVVKFNFLNFFLQIMSLVLYLKA